MESCHVGKFKSATAPNRMGLEAELRLASTGLATATLCAWLLCMPQECLAQTGAAGGLNGGAAPILLTSASLPTAMAIVAEAPAAGLAPEVRRLRELDALLAVRGGLAPATSSDTDAAIAAAAVRGNDKALERPNGFRKKNTDLFRTQRELQIGNQELLVRLRLRAKSRNAMSVELRF